MEPFSLRPRRPTPSLSLPLSLCLVLPPARPVPVAVYKSGRRLYPPTTLHRMEQRGGGTRRRAQGGQRSTREGVRGHTIRVPTASGVTRCNLRRIVAEIRDWNRGRVMNRTRFSRPFSISFRGFRIFYQPTTFPASSRFDGEIEGSSGYCEFNFPAFLRFWIFLSFISELLKYSQVLWVVVFYRSDDEKSSILN